MEPLKKKSVFQLLGMILKMKIRPMLIASHPLILGHFDMEDDWYAYICKLIF